MKMALHKLGGDHITLKELSQLRDLNSEIDMDRERLERLRSSISDPSTSNLTGMPSGNTYENLLERQTAEIIDLERIIYAKMMQRIHERNKLERYIADIPESYLRKIFKLRFIEGLSWNACAARLGGWNTGDGVRKTCVRYIKKHK